MADELEPDEEEANLRASVTLITSRLARLQMGAALMLSATDDPAGAKWDELTTLAIQCVPDPLVDPEFAHAVPDAHQELLRAFALAKERVLAFGAQSDTGRRPPRRELCDLLESALDTIEQMSDSERSRLVAEKLRLL